MATRKQKVYCNILTCENNCGTICANVQIFRIPNDDKRKVRWIEAIKEFQNFDHNRQRFNVCIRHFKESDFERKKNKKVLKSDAIPSIFLCSKPENSYDVADVATEGNNNECDFNISPGAKIAELEKQILSIKIEHDIEKQKLERKIFLLENSREQISTKLIDSNKELNHEKLQNSRMRDTIAELKNEKYISEDDEKFLNAFDMSEVVEILCKGIKASDSYPPSMRLFCLSLHYISPRAYKFVRDKFGKNMPHPETIRQWYRNSDLDASAGIGRKSLECLKELADEMRKKGLQLVISLNFDEINIQRSMVWSRSTNEFLGLIDIGNEDEDAEFSLANNVIVFMACGLNSPFEQPVAFYFIRTLNGIDRTNLVKAVITEITKVGVKVADLCFDGYKANATMCNHLGADLVLDKENEYKTSFKNPHDDSDIYIIYDPSHMIKLVRNTLGNQLVIFDGDTKIEWKYFINLVEFSKNKNYGLTHKLNKRHLQFKDRGMHVRTAVETLSDSAANSMEFLRKKEIPEFANAAATIKFLRIFNRLWDVMNSQRLRNDTFKSAINDLNKGEIFEFLISAKQYILSLEITNKAGKKVPIVTSQYLTGFRGFVIDIISVTAMYKELVEKNHWLIFFASYRISQDHLEMFFGKIRTMNGYNDNPIATQFISAYRKLLHQADMTISKDSNIKSLGTSNILTVSSLTSRRSALKNDEQEKNQTSAELDFEEQLQINLFESNDYLTDNIQDAGVCYIANLIEQRLRNSPHIYCDYCSDVLKNNEKCGDNICVTNIEKPCLSTYQLCKLTDKAIKILINDCPNFKQKVYLMVMRNVTWENIFPEFYDQFHDSDHKHFLVKFIIDEFVNKKCAYIAKQKTIELQKRYIRNSLRKQSHRQHL